MRLVRQRETGSAVAGNTRENPFAPIIGQSPAIQRLIHRAALLATSDVPILINGETGTGKEIFARCIHNASRRAARQFVAFNCACSPLELFEDTLFGHVQGAFTGASRSHRGLVARADGGTLFLDEINSLPIAAQAKMLRFIETGQYQPLGAEANRTAEFRIICATNQALTDLLRFGNFRADLFYRLDVSRLFLPPLRERPEDIPPLACHLVARHARGDSRSSSVPRFAPAAIERLRHHGWPGNVRELENVIRNALALSRNGIIEARHIELDSDLTDLDSRAGPKNETTSLGEAAACLSRFLAPADKRTVMTNPSKLPRIGWSGNLSMTFSKACSRSFMAI